MASGAEADEASGANDEAEKEEPAEILSKVSVPEGGNFMCPSPPCDLQEEADKDSGSAEKDDCPLQASGELRVLSMAGVAGAVESTATRTMGYSDACERLLRATAFQEMEKDRMMKLGW
ncbi:rbcG [Symbiodinium microadriaticum]|nr:rbcG [Symbiodinium microadriaticum]